MTEDVRVGIIGAGYIAQAHAAAYAATPGVRVVAVADPVAAKSDRLAGLCGATAYADTRALMESGLDAVSVCTPSPTHADLAVAALERDLHVLCEKPIAHTEADATRMVLAGRQARTLLMVGHVSRFEPDHAQARTAVVDGRIGPIRMMSQSILSSQPTWSEGSWLTDHAQSGGPIVDLAIHSLDYFAWVTGQRAVRVHARAGTTSAGPETYAILTLRYADGTLGTIETSWGHPASHGFSVATELIGATGRLWWDYAGITGGFVATTEGGRRAFDPLGNRGFRAEIGAFVEAIRSGGGSPVAAEEARSALRTALAARESIQTGQPVDIRDEADR